MTISNETVRVTVIGNGAQTTFSYGFIIPAKAWGQLWLTDTLTGTTTLIDPSLWSMTGANNPAGGTFTYAPAIPATQRLTLLRDVPATQITRLRDQGGFYPSAVEGGLDWIVMQIQQLVSSWRNTLRVPAYEGPIAEIPNVAARAGRGLGFDLSGNPDTFEILSQEELDLAVAEAEAAAAAAAASAAEAGTKGVIPLGTTTGTSSDYVVTAPIGPGTNRIARVRFHVTNAGHPVSLKWNDTLRSLRQADGTAMLEAMIVPGIDYILVDDDIVWRLMAVNDTLQVSAIIEAIRNGTFSFNFKVPGDNFARVAFYMQESGRFVLVTGGDGTVSPREEVFIVEANGDVRAVYGRFIDSSGAASYSSANPPPPTSDARKLLQQLGTPWWETMATATVVSGTRPYFVSGMDVTRGMVRMPTATTHVFFGQMPDTTKLTLRAQNTLTLDAGWTMEPRRLSLSDTNLGSVTTDNGTSTFIFTAGDPVALGMMVGDVWRFDDLTEAGNNNVEFTIVSFGGTSNRTVTVTPAPITDAVPDLDWSALRRRPNEAVAWVWTGTDDGLARGDAVFTSVTSDNAAGTFTVTAGDPVAEGFAVGDVLRPSGLSAGGNNLVDFTITGFSGGSNRTIAVFPAPATDAVADTSFLFTRVGRKRLSIPAGWWKVYKAFGGEGQPTMMCTSIAAYATTTTVPLPTFTRRWVGLGQSWPNRGILNWLWGIQMRRDALGLPRDVFVHQGTAFGASDLLKGTTAAPNNYYWDQDSDTPGPNYDDMLLAINDAPGKGAGISLVICQTDLNGMSGFGPTGNNTPAIRIAMQHSMEARMRSDLGLPMLRFMHIPVTSQRLGLFSENLWYPMRKCRLDMVTLDPTGLDVRGPDCYDFFRPWGDAEFRSTDDRHYGFFYQARHGSRIAAAAANIEDGQSNYLGPPIISRVRTAPNTFEVTIDRAGGIGLNRAGLPVGFAVVDQNNLFADPLPITNYSWSFSTYDILTITTSTDHPDALPVYPYGSMWEAEALDRVVTSLAPNSAEDWPLQTVN